MDIPVYVYNFQVEDFHTYHVGENGVWVHNANYPQKPDVSNPKMQNIVDDLYKGQNGNNTIGNGTTMDAVKNEIKTGLKTNGKFHTQKAKDYAKALERILRRTDINENDKTIAQGLLDDIVDALNGN